MDIEERIACARGDGEVDLLLTNCKIVDVLAGTVRDGSVAISEGLIVGLEEGYGARETLDLEGGYVAPGLLDCHVHFESSMVSVREYAAAVIPRGTTGVVTDCHEIANVMGIDGIRYMMDSAADTVLDMFAMLPSCVPATPLETSGALLEASDLGLLKDEPGVVGLGEMMNFPGTVAGDPGVLAKLRLFQDAPIDGHAPGLRGRELSAYIAAGPDSDHECTTTGEAREKLQKGMYLFLREGTGARNLMDLLPVVNNENSRRVCLCTDDRLPGDLLERGHIDSMLKMVVGAGFSQVTAVQMATLNTARRFGLRGRGAVAAGYRADLVVFDDLSDFVARSVFKDGNLVAKGGIMEVEPGKELTVPPSTFDVKDFSTDRLRIPSAGRKARVIGVIPDQIVTESLELEVPSNGDHAVHDLSRDLLKIAVVERHTGTGNVGLGFVRGFGLREGAIASSVAHDSHNIIVVGASDEDMSAAVEEVIRLGGGQVVVSGGEVRSALALRIAGLMSTESSRVVADRLRDLDGSAAALGCTLAEPFITLSFLALPVIPALKLTDMGLVDVGRFEHVPLFLD